MDPGEALRSNRSVFDDELADLIDSTLNPSLSSTASSPSLPGYSTNQDVTKKRPRIDEPKSPTTEYSSAPTKRVKNGDHAPSDPPSTDYSLHVHPSRQVLLDKPGWSSQVPRRERVLENKFGPGSGANAISVKQSSLPAPKLDVDPDADLSLIAMDAPRTPRAPRAMSLQDDGKALKWSSLHDSVHRQWDERKDNLDCEDVRKHRRAERLNGVDRYVPDYSSNNVAVVRKPLQKRRKWKAFPFERLPEDVQTRIRNLLLVGSDPIAIHFTWLRPFIKGHARMPEVVQKLQGEDKISYLAPVPWTTLQSKVQDLKSDIRSFKGALETRGVKNKAKRAPARALTTGLLHVSRSLHEAATRTFYSQNTFHFTYSQAAWMQLESFLATIGSRNVSLLGSIRITAPLWHRGVHEDYLEGAILDVMSPATRMAIVKPPARDRLLSAVKHSVNALLSAGALHSLAIDLEHPMAADHFTCRYTNDKRLISVAEAQEYVERKATGTALLKQASEALASTGKRPVMTLYHFNKATKLAKKEFRERVPGLIREAQAYGWDVHPVLKDAPPKDDY